MTSRFRFCITHYLIVWVGFLFAVVLVGCQGQPAPEAASGVIETQALPTQVLETREPGTIPSPTGSPTPRPTLLPSATLAPTATQLPSFTPMPTATMTLPPTPFPTLAAAQPYMVYYSAPGGKPSIVLLNADASGRTVLALPENSQIPHLPQALSPDGRWLAFYTGTAGDLQNSAAPAGQFDLTLNVMHLPDGKVTKVAALLAADYPESLRKAAAQVVEKDPSKGLNQTDVYKQLWRNFQLGITQAAWSPDGKTLAFTGEMKSLNSNIYFYLPAAGKTTQVTDGSEQILWHLWSPDGKYVLYGSSNQDCSIDCSTRYALDVTSGKSSKLVNMVAHSGSMVIYGWTGPHSVAYYSGSSDVGMSYLTELDAATGKTVDLYPNAFVDFAITGEQGLIAVTANKDIVTQKSIQPGLYLYHKDSGKMDFVASSTTTPEFSVVYWGQAKYPFLVWDNSKVYGLTADGRLEVITENRLITVTSNQQWIVVLDTKASPPALKIIDGEKQVVKTVSARFAGRMYPNPDSSGFFSVYENGLYYLNLATGAWKQVDVGLPDPPEWSSRALMFGWKP